jgi:hypothetical protein
LKIFLASPSDVVEEREALARLIRDINDVFVYLAPEKRFALELVRYETHSYPDIGAPQTVINRQIPLDYDIFIGVMWRRCGTHTDAHASGTIEEFRRASEKRKQGPLPRIMFYFCEQLIPIPDPEELEQLKGVVEFRQELERLGLTWTYPSHESFSEHLRGGLLRAIRDILREESPELAPLQSGRTGIVDHAALVEIQRLAAEYDQIRNAMRPDDNRTRVMTAIFSQMKAKAAGAIALLEDLKRNESSGTRLAAIAVMQMFPNEAHLDWLAERLDSSLEKPFVGYQAALALLEAVRAPLHGLSEVAGSAG